MEQQAAQADELFKEAENKAGTHTKAVRHRG